MKLVLKNQLFLDFTKIELSTKIAILFSTPKLKKKLQSKVGCLFLICRQTLKKLKNTENMRFNDIRKDFLN